MVFNKIKTKILYCYFIFLLFQSFSCFLIFPFKTVTQNNNNYKINPDSIEYNYSHFFIDNFNQLIYTEIKIGEPPQKVNTFISYNDCNFKIGKARKCIYTSEYLSYYNRNNSKDFNYTDYYATHLQEFEGNKGHSAEETIYAYTDLNLKNYSKFTNIGFYLGSDTTDPLCGIIGLRMVNYALFCQKSNNIITSFKSRNIINNYQWALNYTSKDEGLFVLGSNISELIPNYKDENLYSGYTIMGGSMHPWMLIIYKIECGEYNTTINFDEARVEINNDNSLIIGGFTYNNYIENNFFNEYIHLNICSKNLVTNKEDNYKYYIFECDKTKFGKNDTIKFPKLSFIIRHFEPKFVFEGEDLFTETKYKYFFNIIFSNSYRESWLFGKTFLRKYLTIIDSDRKIIQIYNTNYNKEKDEKKEDEKKEDEKKENEKETEKNEQNGKNNGNNDIKEGNSPSGLFIFLMVLLILVLIIIFSVLFYFIGKNINKIRKKKANELNDEYEYKINEDGNDN